MRDLTSNDQEPSNFEQGPSATDGHPKTEIHPFQSQDGLLIKVLPPMRPNVKHVPCDLVLVIDVSSSMSEDAPVPGDTTERTGLSVLDLTKHAARTILATMNDNDRLGIVTFSSAAITLQKLTLMTKSNKSLAQKKIQQMIPSGMTNLWGGITEALALFNAEDVMDSTNVPAILVLTDGQPNHMQPQPGYIPKLRKLQPFRPAIHTFGFGYKLRSGLLKSISELTGGNYSFISDAGMIGTVFVHAIANLQSTFATEAVLRITYPKHLEISETTGPAVHREAVKDSGEDHSELTIRLGSLHYGQSRDIYLRSTPCLKLPPGISSVVHAALEYRKAGDFVRRPGVQRSLSDWSALLAEEIAYHISRSAIVSYLASINPLDPMDEHRPPEKLYDGMTTQLQRLIETIPARQFPDDPRNKSLLLELTGEQPYGQLSLALSSDEHYTRWGLHYLSSLGGAHERQVCNSFRDPGPLLYGAESTLFVECRDALDAIFESLPPPKPTKKATPKYHKSGLSMRSYHSRRLGDPCFAACSMVELAKEVHGDSMGGAKLIPISRLRSGMNVRTPKGPRRVVAVLRTPVTRTRMCLVGDLLVTSWHPISLDGKVWTYPTHIAQRSVRYTGSIYSVLLQRDSDIDAAALMISGMWGVTLGHGLLVDTDPTPDPRAHTFFGDYDLVVKALSGLHRTRNGLFLGGGARRDPKTGLVDGFQRAALPSRSSPQRKAAST
ncbi:hypothetical protein GQ53DRAFT_728852 [Thozetella sp. PMI_491]|nr:hypothetical protein GQ53DRAFT_728852 [Thozetella sp. PMI_491]